MSTHTRNELVLKLARTIWLIFYILEGLLLFRFFLRLIGANPAASFTSFMYDISYPFITPFLYVVGSPRVADIVIEWPTLIALLFYWFITWIIIRLIFIYRPTQKERSEAITEERL